MTNAQRIALLVGGLVVAVAGFVILRPQEDDEPVREATTTGPAETAPTTGGTESEEPPPPPPKPKFTQPVRMQFKANLEGVFEVELEHRAVPIAQLEVTP
jgi:hypothetical protein